MVEEKIKLTKDEQREWMNVYLKKRTREDIKYGDKTKPPTIDSEVEKLYLDLVHSWPYNKVILDVCRALEIDRDYVRALIMEYFDENGKPYPLEDDSKLAEPMSGVPYYASILSLDEALLEKAKVYDPAAVAAMVGRKKYGKEKFQEMAAAGRRRKTKEEAGKVKPRTAKGKMRVGGGGRFAKLEREITSKK